MCRDRVPPYGRSAHQRGLPARYNGEVRALHHARVRGDTLTSEGTFRGLDIDGNETTRGPVYARATRFDVSTF